MNKKKLLALLMALVMTLTLVPVTAFADGNVAKIGDTGYATLQAAFDAVQNDETITLLADVTSGEITNLQKSGTYTLDLDGHTLNGRINLRQGNLTIKNGTISHTQPLNVYGAASPVEGGHATLTIADDVTINANYGVIVCAYGGTASYYSYGVTVNMNGRIVNSNIGIWVHGYIGNDEAAGNAMDADNAPVVNVGGTIEATDFGIQMSGAAVVNVTGSVTAPTAIGVKRGILNVNGGTLIANGERVDPVKAYNDGAEATGAAISVTSTYNYAGNIQVNVSGGTITSSNNAALFVSHSEDDNPVAFQKGVTLKVTGGSFKGGDDGAVFVAGAINGDATMLAGFITGGTFNSKPADELIKDGYKAVENGDNTWTVKAKDNVAQIGDTQYTTLAAAIAAAKAGDTVKLLGDYDMEANEPGYGYTTSYVAQGENTPRDNMIVIGDGVTFDLGGHTLSNLFNNTFNVTGDNVTIKNGTMNLGQLYYGSYSAEKGVTPNANPTYGSYVMFVNGAKNLTIDRLTTFGGINVAGGSTAVINDLSFSGLSFYAVCSQEGSVVTLNGGNYNKGITGAANYLFWVESGSTMNITGGNYTKGTAKFINGVNPVITGGTFDFDPTSNGVAPGYKAVDNKNGTWTVVVDPATAVARINETYFTTLEAAVDAAQDGDTITLIANDIAVTSTIEITKSITIDGNGKTINATRTSGYYVFNVYEPEETPVTCNISDVTINAEKFQVALLLNSGEGSILNLDNVTVSSDGECVYGNGKSTVNAKNCQFTHSGCYASNKDNVYYSAVMVGYSGVVNLTDCTVKSTDYGVSTFPTGSTINLYNTNVSVINGARGATADPAALWVRVDKGYEHELAVSSYINVYAGSKITGALKTTNTTSPSAKGGQKDAFITCYENSRYSVDPRTDASTDPHFGVIVPDDCTVRRDDSVLPSEYVVEKLQVAMNTATNDTYTDLQTAINEADANQTIKLLRDVNLSDQVEVTKKLTLNLADYKIHNTKDIWAGSSWSLLSVQNGGDLTITGNGTLMPKENDCYAIDVRDNGKLTVESGEIIGNVTAIYAHSGKVTISGGSFRIQQLADNVDTDKYRYTLNCLDANYKTGTSDFTVTGGKFYNFNPQNNLAEGANTNFVADGYEAVAIGDGWYQVGEIKSTAIAKDTTVENTDAVATYKASRRVVDEDEKTIGNSNQPTVTVNLSASTGDVATNNKLPQYDQEKIVAKALEVSNADTMNVSIDVKHDNPQVVENKITYEVHPEATVTSGNETVGTFTVTNDMLSGQTFTIKLPVPEALRTASGKVKVTHKLNNGDEVVYDELAYDAEYNVTIADVTEFSEFELAIVETGSTATAAYGFTLALKDNIEIPFYVYNLSAAASNYYVEYSYTNANNQQVHNTVNLSDYSIGGGWYRVVVASFSARQMGDTVHVKLYTNVNDPIYEVDYSIKQYCEGRIAHSTDTKLIKLCKATLDYGRAAQINFKYNEGNLVSDDYYNDLTEVDIGSEYSATNPAGFGFVGTTISLKSQVAINFYFANADGYTYEVNGQVVTPQQSGNYKVIRVDGISAKNLDKQVTVTVSYGNESQNFSYSPMNYAYGRQENSTDQNLINVCKALYLYCAYANDYLN